MKNDDDLSIGETVIVIAFSIVVVAAIVLVFNVIPWFLWNHGVAPLFGLRHFTFWQIFLLTWAISFVGRMLFGGKKA